MDQFALNQFAAAARRRERPRLWQVLALAAATGACVTALGSCHAPRSPAAHPAPPPPAAASAAPCSAAELRLLHAMIADAARARRLGGQGGALKAEADADYPVTSRDPATLRRGLALLNQAQADLETSMTLTEGIAADRAGLSSGCAAAVAGR